MLLWDYNKRIGMVYLTDKETGQKFEWEIFQGNAFAIMLKRDYEKQTAELRMFFVDKDHAKRMLGLAKGYKANVFNDGIYDYEFNLDGAYPVCLELAQLLRKAELNFTLSYTRPVDEK